MPVAGKGELGSIPVKDGRGGWKSFVVLAIGLGAIVLGALAGITMPLPADTHGRNE
jgi:hypothetical protein